MDRLARLALREPDVKYPGRIRMPLSRAHRNQARDELNLD
jgi:hypothetical protein